MAVKKRKLRKSFSHILSKHLRETEKKKKKSRRRKAWAKDFFRQT